MRTADIPMTRYMVEFVCPSTGAVGKEIVDAYSQKDAITRVRRAANIRIDVVGVRAIGRGGQND